MLNFDPRKWLAENASDQPAHFVATVATVAATLPELKKPHPGTDWGQSQKSVLNALPATVATVATPATFSGWVRQLTRLDPCQPQAGLCMGRRQTLYDDVMWLLENFGQQAARDGWSEADLFGLWPDKPHWGGIADRLCGARSLVMASDRASWRIRGQVESYARGVYPHLRPFWEAGASAGGTIEHERGTI